MNPVLVPERFTVIGENLHASRTLSRNGARVRTAADGRISVSYQNSVGVTHWMVVADPTAAPGSRVHHIKAALELGLSAFDAELEEGAEFLRFEARRQLEAGARYLDLNVDELAADPERAATAMRWAVETLSPKLPVPLCIDSSSLALLETGLTCCQRRAGAPLLNSASLERLEVLDLAAEADAGVILGASAPEGLPQDAIERVDHLERLIDEALSRGLEPEQLYADPLVLPVGVMPGSAMHFLASVRELRARYGPELHLIGGLSNVSFGLPGRRYLNLVFARMAIEAGCDGAILDPLQVRLDQLAALDPEERCYRLVRAVLLGQDQHCAGYLKAWREGLLSRVAESVS